MRINIEIVTCDLCKREDKSCTKVSYPCICKSFEADDTPYIKVSNFDLCPDCLSKVTKIEIIDGVVEFLRENEPVRPFQTLTPVFV